MLIVLRSINRDIKSRDEYSQTKDAAKYLLQTQYVLDTKVSRSRSCRPIYINRGGGGVIEIVFAYLTTIAGSGDIVFTLTVA